MFNLIFFLLLLSFRLVLSASTRDSSLNHLPYLGLPRLKKTEKKNCKRRKSFFYLVHSFHGKATDLCMRKPDNSA